MAYHGQLCQTVAAITGVVVETCNGDSFNVGSRVAGYRSDHPLYADLILVHPDQVCEVPDGISPEDAATVFYYALALEAMNRLESTSPLAIPVICGDTLPCLLLKQLLSDANQGSVWLPRPGAGCFSRAEDLINKGSQAIIGSEQWYYKLGKRVFDKRVHLMGLNADMFRVSEWEGLRSNWIGLSHADACNLNIFSRLSLDLPPYLSRKGIGEALLDMSKRHWSPGAFLTKHDVPEGEEGRKLSLNIGYSLTSSNGMGSNGRVVVRKENRAGARNDLLRVGFIGLGMWARGNFIPFLLRDSRVRVIMGVDQDLIRLQQAADLFDIPIISTNPADVLSSEQVDAVFISTWHDSHAKLAAEALRAGKKVFVEKPLALSHGQLEMLFSAIKDNPNAFLAVGFNRVHSVVTKIIRRELVKEVGPITLTAIVREPTIPSTHYYYWPHQGPRTVSNGCHWIDYAFHLLLPRIPSDIRVIPAFGKDDECNNTIMMRYRDGSLATLSFSNRGESLIGGNEHIDIKCDGTQFEIRDFKTCTRYQEGKVREIWHGKADRGWEDEMRDVVDAMILGRPPRDYRETLQSATLVLEAMHSYRNNGEVRPIPWE
jgi:predicted dehydrogenase